MTSQKAACRASSADQDLQKRPLSKEFPSAVPMTARRKNHKRKKQNFLSFKFDPYHNADFELLRIGVQSKQISSDVGNHKLRDKAVKK